MGSHDSLSRVTVFKRGWRYEKVVEVAGLMAGSGVNQPQRLSFLVPIRGQRLTGVDWLGRWVEWEHPTQGLFAGYVEDRAKPGDTGWMEIAVVGHVNILSKRRTFRRYRPASGPPGAIVARAMSDITLDAGMPFRLDISERGPHLRYEFRGDSVMEVLDTMSSASGQEWASWTDADRSLVIQWRPQVGKDQTQHVVFTEGVNCINARSEMTIEPMVNDLLAIADDAQYSRARGARIIAAGSRGRFGLMQETRRYTGMVTQSALGPKAAIDLRTLALPTATVTLRVTHDEPMLSYVRDGTQIRLVSWQDNAIYRLRVLARDLELDTGVVTLTCDATSDITRATQLNNWSWSGIPTQGSA